MMKSAVITLAMVMALTNALPINLNQLEQNSQDDGPREIWGDPTPTAAWGPTIPTSTAVWATKPSSPADAGSSDNNQIFSPNPRPKSSNQPQQSQSGSKPEPHIITPIASSSSNPRPSNPRPIVPQNQEHDSESVTEDSRSRPEPHVIMPLPSNRTPDAAHTAGLNVPEPQRKPEYKPDHLPMANAPAAPQQQQQARPSPSQTIAPANDDDVIPVFSIVGRH